MSKSQRLASIDAGPVKRKASREELRGRLRAARVEAEGLRDQNEVLRTMVAIAEQLSVSERDRLTRENEVLRSLLAAAHQLTEAIVITANGHASHPTRPPPLPDTPI